MCTVSDGTSTGIFNSVTGGYEFYTTDKITFPIGVYTFTITEISGVLPNSATFTLTLVDLCLTPTLLTANSQTNPLDYTYSGQLP